MPFSLINMIDIHTHILHKIDDGSDSLETSLEMLKEEYSQGVKKVVLTPHFYAAKMSISTFLKERNERYEELKEYLKDKTEIPTVDIGVEVNYFSGISRCRDLKNLTLANSQFVLIEMPFAKWDKQTVYEILAIGENLGLTVILAHINRYFAFKNEKWLKLLAERGINMQLNTECVFDKKMLKLSNKFIRNQYVTFIGSDCHNMTTRLPNLIKLKESIESNFGNAYLEEINYNQEQIFD